MFIFGTPEDTAKVFWDGALACPGPELPDASPDEMSEQQLLDCLAYCRIAVTRAMEAESGQDPEVIAILLKQFDEVFEIVVNTNEGFRDTFIQGHHRYVGGYDLDNVNKYRLLANLPPLAN